MRARASPCCLPCLPACRARCVLGVPGVGVGVAGSTVLPSTGQPPPLPACLPPMCRHTGCGGTHAWWVASFSSPFHAGGAMAGGEARLSGGVPPARGSRQQQANTPSHPTHTPLPLSPRRRPAAMCSIWPLSAPPPPCTERCWSGCACCACVGAACRYLHRRLAGWRSWRRLTPPHRRCCVRRCLSSTPPPPAASSIASPKTRALWMSSCRRWVVVVVVGGLGGLAPGACGLVGLHCSHEGQAQAGGGARAAPRGHARRPHRAHSAPPSPASIPPGLFRLCGFAAHGGGRLCAGEWRGRHAAQWNRPGRAPVRCRAAPGRWADARRMLPLPPSLPPSAGHRGPLDYPRLPAPGRRLLLGPPPLHPHLARGETGCWLEAAGGG